MLRKVRIIHCAGCVSANTRPYQLCCDINFHNHESAVIVTSSDSIVFVKTSITSPHAGTLIRLVVA